MLPEPIGEPWGQSRPLSERPDMPKTTEPAESIDVEHYHQGTHAYLTLTHMTLSEAVRFAFTPRFAKPGDNVSPPMTLAHAGQVMAMLGEAPDEPIVVTHMTQYRREALTSGALRVTGAEGTLVHKRG